MVTQPTYCDTSRRRTGRLDGWPISSRWRARSSCSRRRPPCDPGGAASRRSWPIPVGWAAGELPVQGIVAQLALLGLLAWWGWPSAAWLSLLVFVLAFVVLVENLALVFIAFYSRRIVRRSMAEAPVAPLKIPRARDDAFGAWWRTAMQFPFHPRDMQLVKNVPYGPLPRQRLDVWRMSTTPLHAPVVLFVHGGSWMMGDKREQGRPMLHEFVRRGWIAVVPNYRLAPRHPWPAQIRRRHARTGLGEEEHRDLRRRPRARGHRRWLGRGPAGGPRGTDANDPTWRPKDMSDVTDWSVRGAMPFYGVLEMIGDESHWRGLGRGLRVLLERRIVQVPFDGNEPLYRAMSPFDRIRADAPPFFVVQGRNDTLVDVQVARDFVAKFRADRARADLLRRAAVHAARLRHLGQSPHVGHDARRGRLRRVGRAAPTTDAGAGEELPGAAHGTRREGRRTASGSAREGRGTRTRALHGPDVGQSLQQRTARRGERRASYARCTPTCNAGACELHHADGSRSDGRVARRRGLRAARSERRVRPRPRASVGPVRDL